MDAAAAAPGKSVESLKTKIIANKASPYEPPLLTFKSSIEKIKRVRQSHAEVDTPKEDKEAGEKDILAKAPFISIYDNTASWTNKPTEKPCVFTEFVKREKPVAKTKLKASKEAPKVDLSLAIRKKEVSLVKRSSHLAGKSLLTLDATVPMIIAQSSGSVYEKLAVSVTQSTSTTEIGKVARKKIKKN